MKTHSLVQGTPEWHAYRASHFNASDAPAMLGCSAYKTRSQLLHELATGHTQTVDAATQRRFDDGHRFEALARPLAEKIIGQDLYPVVGSEGEYSASFDGLSMDESENFEHKSLNDDLRAAFADIETIAPEYRTNTAGRLLPEQYRVQMEQQHMVSGCTRTLFMASKWNGDTLVEERHCWYYTDMALRAKIVAGWAQLKQDLAAYVPPEVTVEPVAKAASALPVVFDMRVEGRLVSCNLDQYKPVALAYIAAINTELVTDQNFADADADAKFCRASADKLNLAAEQVLGQMGDINQALNTVREIAAAFNGKGLALEKLVKAEKENRRTKILSDAVAALHTHMKGLQERTRNYMPTVPNQFQDVIKGLKSLDSMKDKLAGELARCKIEANATADRIQANLEAKGLHGYAFLFSDIATLCLKAPDDFANTVTARITAHEAADAKKEADTRERIRAEEQAKLVAEQEAAAKAERDRIASEAAKVESIVTAPDVAPALTHTQVVQQMPATVRQAISAAGTPEPTLKLGDISARIAPLSITAEGLRAMGFEPAKSVGASKLYHEANFPKMVAAMQQHLGKLASTHREPVAA